MGKAEVAFSIIRNTFDLLPGDCIFGKSKFLQKNLTIAIFKYQYINL